MSLDDWIWFWMDEEAREELLPRSCPKCGCPLIRTKDEFGEDVLYCEHCGFRCYKEDF